MTSNEHPEIRELIDINATLIIIPLVRTSLVWDIYYPT